MGFWTFFKSVLKFCVAALTGYEVSKTLQGDSAADEVKKEFRALKEDVISMVNQLKSALDIKDAKLILFILFAVLFIMMFFLLATKLYNMIHKSGKKSGQRALQ